MNQIGSCENPLQKLSGIKIYKGIIEAGNMDELKSFGDELRNRIKAVREFYFPMLIIKR
jgi:hypothetical protein